MRQASPKGAQGKSKAQARPRQRTSKAALKLPLATPKGSEPNRTATQREANRIGPQPKGHQGRALREMNLGFADPKLGSRPP